MSGRAEVAVEITPAQRHLLRARALATLLDSSIPIPGTGKRIGLDPLLGVIPFVGDFAGAILSAYIVIGAALSGVPTFTLIRMLGNIGIDTLVGSIPLFGDVFDAAWKSNAMNVTLFERHVARNAGSVRTIRQVSALSGIIMTVIALLALALFTFVIYLLYLGIRHGFTQS